MSAELHKPFAPYIPEAGEEYMNSKQLAHFRAILGGIKGDLITDIERTVHTMQDEATVFADPNDRASQETDIAIELRNRDRERKLIKKIDEALVKHRQRRLRLLQQLRHRDRHPPFGSASHRRAVRGLQDAGRDQRKANGGLIPPCALSRGSQYGSLLLWLARLACKSAETAIPSTTGPERKSVCRHWPGYVRLCPVITPST